MRASGWEWAHRLCKKSRAHRSAGRGPSTFVEADAGSVGRLLAKDRMAAAAKRAVHREVCHAWSSLGSKALTADNALKDLKQKQAIVRKDAIAGGDSDAHSDIPVPLVEAINAIKDFFKTDSG